mmetsp:Transcript_9455/g.10776  ORF Transcript_9455/g.10776 Transcript_9455/m.10776 type:complete len:347 (-) Transcript_9455:114-1154(-)
MTTKSAWRNSFSAVRSSVDIRAVLRQGSKSALAGGRSARQAKEQLHLVSTSQSIALSGGVNILKEGLLSAKSEGKFAFLSGWKTKYVRLEYGKILFYSPKAMADSDEESEEGEINIADIRRVEYLKRGDKKFALVLGSEKGNGQWTRSKSGKSTGSDISRSSNVSDNPLNGSKGCNYKESKLYFKHDSSDEIVDWIKHLLVELKNQALILDNTVEMLIKNGGNSLVIEALLRQAVDLWELAVGSVNEDTANAQELLAKWLKENGSSDSKARRLEEAEFWEAKFLRSRENIKSRNAVLKNMENARGKVQQRMIETLNEIVRSRSSAPVTALDEIQEETAVFGLDGDN